ncbi:MAG: sporulation protein YqfD [Clostridia bacterium]|nr:sporulation protein YqfD [Clostridia bacterium]
MNWLWRFLTGYLIIEINADSAEKLLNKATINGIRICNLHCKKGKITGNITINDFLNLRYAKRGIKCRIKIINKKGLIFNIRQYKNRFGVLVGLVAFISTLVILSNYIWIIKVEGNKRIPTGEIIKICKEVGITEGVLKSKINNKYDAQKLQLLHSDIAWCSLNTEGSVLTVNLSETAFSDKEERKYPTNLKASFTGKIKRINVTSGNTVVKVNDYVTKGDLLVSGIVQNLTSDIIVHSSGEIIAETKRVFSAEGRYIQEQMLPTNEIHNRYTVSFFNLKLPFYLGNIKDDNNYKCDTRTLRIFNKKIPIKTATERYEILTKKIVKYDDKGLENALFNDIKKQVNSFKFISSKEVNREVIKSKQGMLLKVEYLCEENIATEDKILLNTEN